jgi:hypothetical protein
MNKGFLYIVHSAMTMNRLSPRPPGTPLPILGEGKTSLDSAFLGFSKRILALKVIVSPIRGDAEGRGVLLGGMP